MLTKKDIEKIANLLKIDSKTLTEAISSEKETDIEIPELSVFTAAEIDLRDKNKYDAGKVAGVEILVKDLKESHGVEVEGKDPAKFLEAYRAKTLKDANIEPDKRVEEANRVAETLRGNLSKIEGERDALAAKIRTTELQTKAFAGIEGEFVLPKEKILHLMTADGYTLDEEGGAVIFKQNGTAIRDAKTQAVLDAGKVLQEFATTQGLVKESPDPRTGRGGKGTKSNPGVPTSYSQLAEQWQKEGKSLNSSEFSARAMELAKDNADFFNS